MYVDRLFQTEKNWESDLSISIVISSIGIDPPQFRKRELIKENEALRIKGKPIWSLG